MDDETKIIVSIDCVKPIDIITKNLDLTPLVDKLPIDSLIKTTINIMSESPSKLEKLFEDDMPNIYFSVRVINQHPLLKKLTTRSENADILSEWI